jgi:signal transduction histidine kinase
LDGTLALLIALIIGIEVAIPVGTYLLFKGRHDDKTQLWFISVVFCSASIILVSLRPLLSGYASHQIAWLLMIGGFQLMLASIHRELRRSTYWGLNIAAYLAWGIWVHVMYFMGLNETLGYLSYSLYLALLSMAMLWLLWQLNKTYKSLSLRIIQIGFTLYMVPAVLRVVAYLNTGSIDQLNVFKFSMVTNFLVFTWVLAQMFIPFGYWGFTLEKAQREREEAEAGEDQAIQSADRYRQLLEERDQLLVMNSRFSVVSSLSSFSAMLIHDITQPLQTLQLGLERVRANLIKGATRNQIEDDLLHLEHASDRAGALVLALRSLMQSGEKQTAPVPIEPLMRQIEEILSSEALQKRVAIHFENRLPAHCEVLADRVMLQRIIINLVSNSLNHFAVAPVGNPEVAIRLHPESQGELAGVTIEVQDNGGGFPLALLERVGQPWSSHQPQGLGMALMLSKQLLGIWGGQLRLSNRADGQSGALVQIWLRLAN